MDEMAALVKEKSVGQTVQIELEREKVKLKLDVDVEGLDKVNCRIELIKNPSDEQLLIRDGLLSVTVTEDNGQ